MTTDLGSCEWFVWDLRRSNLIERGVLDPLVSDFLARHPQAEPPQLADYLVQRNLLTRFQADSILAGKYQGLVLGPYVVCDTLGSGSMGTVYKAYSKTNNAWFAVKVLPRRSMWNIRLARRKVREFEQIRHPAVVPFTDVGTAGSIHYLVWPLVEGEPLSKLVERQGALPPALAAYLVLQVAEGLEACHQRGILHGLIKPSNILVTPDHRVHILDFGIGALLAETENESVVDTMSTANTMASGLDCASPEGIMDPTQMTAASDQYSLGCVLYFCLTGQVPFPGNNAVEKMMAHQTKQPRPIAELAPDVPEELTAIVSRLMQKQPQARYGSLSEAIVELRPFAAEMLAAAVKQPRSATVPAGAPASTRRPTPPPPTLRPSPEPALPPTRPLPPPPLHLPDRRSLETTPDAAVNGPPAPGLGQRQPMRHPLPRPNLRELPGGPGDKAHSSSSDRLNLLLIVAMGLIACVVGWLLAGWVG
jgi:serine/threonine-protein kinase